MKNSPLTADKPGWHTVSTETVYKSKNLEVTEQTVLTPARPDKPRPWTVVHRKAAVVVAPMTADGNFLMIQQERIPVRAFLWEFPAGQIDAEDEIDEMIIRDTAVRELREETGYELAAGVEMTSLGYFFTSQGFTDEHNYLFLAKGVEMGEAGASADESEGILAVKEFTPSEFRRMVAENEIVNANTLSLYARLCARGLA